jgi:hypothetical protein
MRLLLFFLATCTVLAQDATPQAGKLASVEGLVVNALTGEPVVRAHVMLTPDSQSMKQKFGAMTTAEGNFSVLRMPPGSYTVTAERVGYVSGDSASASKTRIELQSGDKQDSVTVKLTPLGAISGRVVNSAGEPLESVHVYAEHASKSMGDVATDENGAFRVGGLAPGNYRVKASPQHPFTPPEIRTDGTREVHYVPAYYPNSPTAKTAARVHVSPGAEASGIEIQLPAGPIVRVSGKISNPLGPGLFGIWINWANGASLTTSFRADGSFEIWGLYPGKYSLATHGEITPGQPVSVSQPLDVEVGDSNVDGIRLTPLPPLAIHGRIEYEDDDARPKSLPVAPQVLLQDLGRQRERPADLTLDDSFQLDKISPLRYRVGLSWPSAYVKSMRLGGTEIDGSILDLSSGVSAALAIRVSSAMAAVSGTVHMGDKPASGVLVALISDNPNDLDDANVARYATAARDGTYSFDPIPPGRYKLAAVNERDTRTLDDIEDYGNTVETVEVHEGERVTTDLRWSPADQVN